VLRPFTITDIGLLNAYKQQVLFLQNQAQFTQGRGALMRSALLSPLSTLTGTFTYLSASAGDGRALIGQAVHRAGSPLAYCTFFAPESALSSPEFPELLEQLLHRVGERGAQSLVAEVEEGSPAFAALRQAGFSIYARQRVWRLAKIKWTTSAASGWRPVFSRDEMALQLLRGSLLPGQVQQIEATDSASSDGYVFYSNGELQAYVEVMRGRQGIWAQPLVDLDAEPFDQLFAELIAKLRPRANRPLYICLRSYQDWLEGALQDFDAEPGPRQAVMAKRIALPLKAEEARRVPAANRRAEPTTPIHVPLANRGHEPEWMTYDQTSNYR